MQDTSCSKASNAEYLVSHSSMILQVIELKEVLSLDLNGDEDVL